MRQRGEGSWVLRVYLGRDPLTGEKRWKYKTFKGGKREAQRALAAMVADADGSGFARHWRPLTSSGAISSRGSVRSRWRVSGRKTSTSSTASYVGGR